MSLLSMRTRHRMALCCAFVLLTCLLVTNLSACEVAGEGSIIPIPQPEIDLTPTDELVIYLPSYDFLVKDMMPAIDAYKKEYPNVNVVIEFVNEEILGDLPTTYGQRVATELMSGTGPDILITWTFFFPNIYKTMDTGALLDLSDIMDEDEEFNVEDYYRPVLDAGVYKGGRYFVPYSFRAPVLTALPSHLEEVGFDLSKSTDAVSFFNELSKCLPRLTGSEFHKYAISEYPYSAIALYYAGIDLIDYENRRVLPDEEGLKSFCEAYKSYWQWDYQTTEYSNKYGLQFLETYQTLFSFAREVDAIMYVNREAKVKGIPTVITTIPSMDGGMNATMESGLAIRSTSPNQLNAWNFIKTMLMEQKQQVARLGGGPSLAFPVNKDALRYNVEIYNKPITPGGSFPGESLAEKEIQPLYDLLDSITNCNIINYTLFGLETSYFETIMNPYFRDEKSYDECVTELKRKLQLYLDE